MEQVRNRFADAVRRVAALAPSVDSKVLNAGKALAVGLSLLAAPVIYSQGVDPMSKAAIKGASEAARTASETTAMARRQGEFSTYYSCGLLKVAKANLGGFSESAGIAKLRTIAVETLSGADRMPAPSSSLGQTVNGVATMARTLAMVGLSSAAEAVIGGQDNKEWAGHWRAEMSSVTDSIAHSAQNARLVRDLGEVEQASVEIDDAYEGMGCDAPRI